MRVWLLVLLALVAVVAPSSAQFCLDENGASVDWWLVVKMARQEDSSFAGVAQGTAYLYADAKSYATPAAFWLNSTQQVSDASSSVGRTVQQIYDHANDTAGHGYVMYNDEIPGGATSDSYGHSKGFLAWSAAGAFWLVHSVPKFADTPANVDTYAYPDSGEEYGQSMLCISIDLANVDQAFKQFQYTNPQVYGSQWASSLAAHLPNGDAFLNNGQVDLSAATSMVNITSVGGVHFTHFAKTVAWGKSIFGDLIGPWYGQDMVVETWQRPYEDPLTPPDVSTSVYSVLNLSTPPYAQFDGVTWTMDQDHAKWGIVTDRSVPAFCIGDINKQVSQWKRSGGMMCILDNTIHQAFLGFIVTTDETNSTQVPKEALAAAAGATEVEAVALE